MPPPVAVPAPPNSKKDPKPSTASKKATEAVAGNQPTRSTRSKQVARVPAAIKIKQEPIDPIETAPESEESRTSVKSTASAKSTAAMNQKDKKKKASRVPSGESVYEDALTEQNKANGAKKASINEKVNIIETQLGVCIECHIEHTNSIVEIHSTGSYVSRHRSYGRHICHNVHRKWTRIVGGPSDLCRQQGGHLCLRYHIQRTRNT